MRRTLILGFRSAHHGVMFWEAGTLSNSCVRTPLDKFDLDFSQEWRVERNDDSIIVVVVVVVGTTTTMYDYY